MFVLGSSGCWIGSSEAQHTGHGFQKQLERWRHERCGDLYQHYTVRTEGPWLCLFYIYIFCINLGCLECITLYKNETSKWISCSVFQRCLWPAVWSGDPSNAGWTGRFSHPGTRYGCTSLSLAVCVLPVLHCLSLLDDLLSSHEKSLGNKEVVVSVSLVKDSDSDSCPSKTTSNQSSPLIIRGKRERRRTSSIWHWGQTTCLILKEFI